MRGGGTSRPCSLARKRRRTAARVIHSGKRARAADGRAAGQGLLTRPWRGGGGRPQPQRSRQAGGPHGREFVRGHHARRPSAIHGAARRTSRHRRRGRGGGRLRPWRRCCASSRQPTIAGVSSGWCGPSSPRARPEPGGRRRCTGSAARWPMYSSASWWPWRPWRRPSPKRRPSRSGRQARRCRPRARSWPPRRCAAGSMWPAASRSSARRRPSRPTIPPWAAGRSCRPCPRPCTTPPPRRGRSPLHRRRLHRPAVQRDVAPCFRLRPRGQDLGRDRGPAGTARGARHGRPCGQALCRWRRRAKLGRRLGLRSGHRSMGRFARSATHPTRASRRGGARQ